MDFNFAQNIEYCGVIVGELSNLLYYSHFITGCIAMVSGLFIYLQNRSSLLAKIFLSLMTVFTLWCFSDILIWSKYDSASTLMAAWGPIEVLSITMFILCLYFLYVYTEEKDISWTKKIIFFIILAPTWVLSSTGLNLEFFDIQECIAGEAVAYQNYIIWIKVFLSAWIISLCVRKFIVFRKSKQTKKILIISIGMLAFLLSFFVAGIIAERTSVYAWEMVGLFGMLIFIVSLGYLTIRFKAFNLKVFAAQLLVGGLWFLVFPLMFLDDIDIIHIIVGITFILLVVFGYYLIKSVARQIEAKEKIEQLATGLEKANNRLTELDKQKTEFISFATHQLRAPLTAMRGYTSLILEGDLGEITSEQRNAITRISDSSKTLANVVDDYLNVSRIELGTMKYTLDKIDLKAMVESSIAELKPNIDSKKSIQFSFSAAPVKNEADGYMVLADRDKFKQVLANLIDNSVKYTPAGNVKVSLERIGGNVRFTVKDTGVGIAPELMPKLFSKFIRANTANAVNIHGTGLGLFVAKDVVLAHHGKIWAESEGEGKGSAFIVEIAAA